MNHFEVILSVDKMLKDIGVVHWLSFGTLLGIHREGGPIKGDNDIDFDCYAEDMEKNLSKIAWGLDKLGYKVKIWPEFKKIKIIAKSKHAEVAIAGFRKKGAYRIRNKWRIPEEYFTNVGYIEYKGVQFRCHYPIGQYLAWVYSDWETPMPKHLGNKLYKKKVLRKC